MFVRLFRIGAVLVLVLACISCGDAKPSVLAPLPVSTSSDDSTIALVKDPVPAGAVVIYSQPPKPSGELLPSSWRAPDGSDTDRFVWENFGFENAQTISELRWRGGYDPAKQGSGGPAQEFTIDIYQSIPAGSEPDLAIAPLVHYRIEGNAGETPSEVLAGVQTYDYRFTLPVPFEADAATTYWLQVEAFQSGDPDWGLLAGSGTLGDGRHFRGTADGYYYQLVLEDAAIEFLAPVVGGATPVAEVAASLEDIAAMLENLPPAEEVPVNEEGVQEVMLVVSRSGYTPLHFAVKAGVPVRLIFRQLGYVPGGNELFVRWGAKHETYLILASPSDTKILDFTPQEPGEYRFSCPHDWYEGVMTVQG
ncbi:MAG: cupredoxin domain-containing protein [Anaerolineae bacterium]|nr:cupredoxin domain-containing protein [Anaerolineae bacterium]